MIDVVRDKSTFIDAHRYPEGVEDILMNGGVVIERVSTHGLWLAGSLTSKKRSGRRTGV